MIINEISMRNVRRYSGQQAVSFPSPTGNKRVHLIGANNGVGKTTLFDAINACLFATREDPILRAKDITRTDGPSGNNEMAVDIRFEHESQSYVLSRQWTRRPGPSEYGINSVILTSLLQNRDSGDSSTDDDEIAAFMRALIPFETRRLFLFDGEQVQTYIDQASDSVKDAIERLLGLHLYIRLQEDIRTIEQNLQAERSAHDVGDELLGKQEALDRNDVDTRSNDRRQEELRRASAQAQNEYARLQMEETRLEGLFDPVTQAKRRELEIQRETLQSDVERLETTMAELLPDEVLVSWFWPEIDAALSRNSGEGGFLPADIKELGDVLYRNRVAISESLESDSPDRFQDLLNNIFGFDADDGLTGNVVGSLRMLARRIQGSDEKITSPAAQLHIKRSELDRLGHEIASLPSAELFDLDVKRLHEEMEGHRTAQARHEESIRSLERDKDRLATQREQLTKEIGRLTEDNHRYREINDTLDVCRRIREILSVFVSDFRSTRVSELEDIVNDKFRALTNAPGLIDAIQIDRESVELKLIDDESEMLAGEQSAGQKEILAFALIASVVDLSNRQVPAVIDTPLARLDVQHRDNVLRRFFPYLGPQVIVLATDSEVGRQEVNQLSPILASSHHLELDSETGHTIIKDGYLDD